MNNVIITVGISGAGKSSWSTNFIKENPKYLRLNRDDIRKTLVGDLDGYYQRNDLKLIEDLVSDLEESYFYKVCNHCMMNLIIDNTHLKESYIKRWINIFDKYKDTTDYEVDYKFKFFDVDLEVAKHRVMVRENWLTDDYMLEDFKVEYIEKQYQQYKNIKKFIEDNYKDRCII